MTLELTSPAFDAGAAIPRRHAADDANLSPPLSWTGAPRTAGSFALIVEDPDAPGGWVHWAVWNVPSHARGLPEGVPPEAFGQGVNGYGHIGWGGPRPPRGEGAHRYVFRLHALDTLLDLKAGATREQLESAMHSHLLELATLTGKYCRSR